MRNSNPGIAAVLSFLFNGLGQVYNGQITKGLVIMLFSMVAMGITLIGALVLAHFILTGLFCAAELKIGAILSLSGIIAIAAIGVYNIYDAYNTAKE